jgi:hypothetical protein
MSRLAPLAAWVLAGFGFCLPLALASDADKAQEVFESLYGPDVKKIQASHDGAGAAVLAARLLEAAKTADSSPALQVLLCQKAAELGSMDPKGYDTAEAAADLLVEKSPGNESLAREMIIQLHQRRYEISRPADKAEAAQVLLDDLLTLASAKAQAGDTDEALKRLKQAQAVLAGFRSPLPENLTAQAKRVADLSKTMGRVQVLKGLLGPDAAGKTAREELVRLLFLDLDSPAEAAKYLDESSDPQMRKYLPALARKVDETPELACLEIGDWLRGLAGSPTGAGKAGPLRRAIAYYERFLSLHSATDLDRTKATLALGKLQADLDKLGDPGLGLWIDLLKNLTPPKSAVLDGTWQQTEAGWTGVGGLRGGKIQVPLVPQGNYELDIRFVKTGKNGLWLHLPVPDTTKAACMLALGGWLNTASAIEMINATGGNKNPSSVKLSLEDKHPYRLQVKVVLSGEQVTIAAALDGRTVVQWSGPPSALSVYSSWAIPQPKCIGLAAGASTSVTYSSARLRMTSGKAIPLDKFAPPAPTTPKGNPPRTLTIPPLPGTTMKVPVTIPIPSVP